MSATDGEIDVLILGTARPGSDASAVEQALRDAAAAWPGAGLATILPPSTLPALAHVTVSEGALPDAILTVRGTQAALADGLGATTARLSAVIDPQRSSLLATTRHAILPGDDAVRLMFGLRRLERLSLAEFQDYWLNRHAQLGRRLIPPYTYHQLHTLPAATEALAAAAGIAPSTLDGIVEVHFPDVEAFVRQLSRPEVAEEALADERNFIDHDRSIFWAYRTL